MKDYGWVTQINGLDYYRSIRDPKDEICVIDGEIRKCKKKIKHLKAEEKK